MRTSITLLLAIVLLASCNQYKKTPSGFAYKITKGDGKVPLKNGMYIKFNIEYKVPSKDTTLASSYGHIPAFTIIDTARGGKHNFTEIITQCAVGDKVEFTMSVDTLQKMGALQYDNVFHPKDMIKGKVEFLKAYTTQEEALADRNKEIEAELAREKKTIADYASSKKIKVESTRSGAVVEIESAGDLTNKADSGKTASILYKGLVLNGNGVPFDSNTDPKQSKPLLVVNVGSTGTPNSVIPGLDQGLRFFGKGGKGKVYIPAMAAYGEQGSPPVIPQYANLVFEIEVKDVTTTPAPAAATPAQPAPGTPAPNKK